jgi:hypothetical protein
LAARSRHAAADGFVRSLQRALSCVTNSVLYESRQTGARQAVTLADDPVQLSSTRGSREALRLSVIHQYEAVRQGRAWRVSSRAYYYRVDAPDGAELLSWHWHPAATVKRPHLHVAALDRRRHLPTGRVSLEAVLRLLLTEFDVRPQRPDWEGVLVANETVFEQSRTWP